MGFFPLLLPFFFFNFNDCVNCGKNLEFKIKKAFGQVVFIYSVVSPFAGFANLAEFVPFSSFPL